MSESSSAPRRSSRRKTPAPTPDASVLRCFDDDAAATAALRRVYGTIPAHIKYPDLTSCLRKREHPRRFGSASFSATGISSASSSMRSAAVSIPVNGRRHEEKPAAIDRLPVRRRHSEAIQAELEETRSRINGYRPPHVRPVATDAEKDRLTERFTYGGGKALPDELTLPQQPIPSEERARQNEAERVARALAKRRASSSRSAGSAECQAAAPAWGHGTNGADANNEALATQIMEEIEERQEFLEAARKARVVATRRSAEEERVLHEVRVRMAELQALERRKEAGGMTQK